MKSSNRIDPNRYLFAMHFSIQPTVTVLSLQIEAQNPESVPLIRETIRSRQEDRCRERDDCKNREKRMTRLIRLDASRGACCNSITLFWVKSQTAWIELDRLRIHRCSLIKSPRRNRTKKDEYSIL